MKLLRNLTRINPFAVVETALTLVSLALVAVTVGQELAPILGLTGTLGTAVSWSAAIVFDVVWVGALKMSSAAVRQRSVPGMAVMGGVAVLAVGTSTAILLTLGHAAVFAFTPVAAMVFMGLRMFAASTLADAATTAVIDSAALTSRNEAALARNEARTLAAQAERDVILDTAAHLAGIRRDVVRIETLTSADVRLTKARAEAMAKLEKSQKQYGAAAARFHELMSSTAPQTTADTVSDTADTQVNAPEAPAPKIVDAPADTVDDAFEDVVSMLEAAPAASSTDLADIARVAGVPLPKPGETLTDAQISVVMRWLRYSQNPPLSYRAVQRSFREHGFKGTDSRLRLMWADTTMETI
jgi:hypothetical protein